MPKRKHDDVSEDLDETIPEEPTTKKKKRPIEETNGNVSHDVAAERIEYWLVRKPKNVKISELPTFRLPKRLPAKDTAVLRPDRETEFFTVKFSTTDKQMFYIDRNNAKTTSSGKTRVKPTAELRGTMMMEVEGTDDDYTGPLPPQEDFLNPGKCDAPMKMPFNIPIIRPLPYSGKADPIERLKSFGSGKKTKKRQESEEVEY